jgi:hypothetical protein
METHFEIAGAKGSRFALKATFYTELIVLFIAVTFAATVGGLRYIKETFATIGYINTLSFVILTLLFAYILGKRAGISIFKKNSQRFLIGYSSGFLIVFSATLITSVIALLTETFAAGLPTNWFALYILKPIIWLFCTSCLPVIIAGSWYGFKFADHAGRSPCHNSLS